MHIMITHILISISSVALIILFGTSLFIAVNSAKKRNKAEFLFSIFACSCLCLVGLLSAFSFPLLIFPSGKSPLENSCTNRPSPCLSVLFIKKFSVSGHHFLLHMACQFYTAWLLPKPLAKQWDCLAERRAWFWVAKQALADEKEGWVVGGVGCYEGSGWRGDGSEHGRTGREQTRSKVSCVQVDCQADCHVSHRDWLLWASGCFGVYIKRTDCELKNISHTPTIYQIFHNFFIAFSTCCLLLLFPKGGICEVLQNLLDQKGRLHARRAAMMEQEKKHPCMQDETVEIQRRGGQ